MMHLLPRLTAVQFAQFYQWAKVQNLLKKADASTIFIDFDILDSRLDHLKNTFPENTLHAVAIKSNPLLEVLKHNVRRGFGLEAATFEEVLLAKKAGIENEKLVFDSPVKRQSEIDFCEKNFPGIIVNANTIKELSRYKRCTNLQLGLRINPLADTGSPGIYAVSERGSKFGEPLTNREKIIQAFVETPLLDGLHIHIGSDIRNLENTADAIAQLFKLADDIENACERAGKPKKINRIDIGGGLPGKYAEGEQPGLEAYVSMLRARIPNLEKRQIITEYGRFTNVHCGWLVSEIEYILEHNDPQTLMLHNGAELFVREIYSPEGPKHLLYVLDNQGFAKKSLPEKSYDLAGPLCFNGDFLDKNRPLPKVKKGDKVVVADIGANSFALWSKHCSRAFPKVIGYSQKRGEIRILRKRETAQEAIKFWG